MAAAIDSGYDAQMKSKDDSLQNDQPVTFRTIGILGGMGPAATVDLMQKVIDATPATRDQEHVPMIVWNIPQIPNRTLYLAATAEGNPDLYPSPCPAMCAGARALADAGAEAIVIACNTAHHWADEVAAAANIPLIHIADAALAQLQRAYLHTAVLLATNGTHQLGLYQKRAAKFGITLIQPDDLSQARIMAVIALVKAGRMAEARAEMISALYGLTANSAEIFLLGCTELPLVVRGTPFEAKSVDATMALAAEIVRFSTGLVHELPPHNIKTTPNKRGSDIGDKVA